MTHALIELGLALLPIVGISLAPSTYTEGGGGLPLDDVDVQFLALRFGTSTGTPYDKPGNKVVPLLIVDMLPEGTTDVHQQYFSCGDLEHWAPTADGETLAPQSDKARTWGGIRKDCNAAMFLASLVTAGVPPERLASEKVSDLAGIKAHVVSTKRPAVKGSTAKTDKAGNVIEPSVLTVNRLISVPWGAVQSATVPSVATSAAAQHKPATPINGNGGVFDDTALSLMVVQLLGDAPNKSLAKMQLMQHAFKAANGGMVPADSKDPDGKPARTTIPNRVTNDAFLSSGTMWRYDGNTVTLIQ